MKQPSPLNRRRAVALAGHIGDESTARDATDDPDPGVRAASLRSLARLGVLEQSALARALTDTAPRVRCAGLEIAANRTIPEIIDLLDDSDPSVVETAAWACGERVDAKGAVAHPVAQLVALSADHPDILVREAAVAALGAIGDPAALPAVLSAMGDKPAIRRRAVLALAAFEGPEVDSAWENARLDHDRQVRDAVDELMGPA